MARTRPKRLALVAAAALVAALGPVTASAAPEHGHPHTGDDGLTTLGLAGWQVQSSAVATQPGADVSAPGFDTAAWLKVHPDDAGAPGTEIGALLQNGECPDVFVGDTMRQCFGYMSKRGPVTVPRFAVPWWFRTEFTAPAGKHADLVLNGVVGECDVWVNGTQVAGHDVVTGAFVKRSFDISSLVHAGANALAIEMHPNNPNEMFTLDDADWNQIPPDNNTGIQFPVQLRLTDGLTDTNAHVVQHNNADLTRSDLTVKTDVTNNTDSARSVAATAMITAPSGRSPIVLHKTVPVAAHHTATVTFPAVTINHPQVWWPYRMGAQPLYTLDTSVRSGNLAARSTRDTFGIRTISTKLIGAAPQAPDGVRQFAVNGKPIVFRAGGYAPELFLRYSKTDVAHQISLIRNLGLNGIRLEGHDMPDDFYQQMDRAGILIDAGFMCCDAWELPSDGVTDHDYQVIHDSALTLGQRLRNHPSILNYSWSDNSPIPRQETESINGFHEADFQEPLIASAEYKSTEKLGPAGEKEGPYDWVPPSYWYDTTHYDAEDDSRTNAGGSWGFASEQSAGDTVPTLDSIHRFLTADEQAKLWQDPEYNQFHANYEPGHGGYKFGTLYTFDQALSTRYGQWSGLDSYVQMAQIANYENTRSQFEAFLAHSTNKDAPSTGVIYWQLNKGWPTLLWSLYNADGDQPGSFFGAKKANAPVHAIYTYDDGTVALDNLGAGSQKGLSVQAKVYDTKGKLLDDQTSPSVDLASQQVRTKVLTPKVPATTTPPAKAKVSFVELLVRKGGTVVDRNVYWISTQKDVVDWPSSYGNPQATLTQYAAYQDLQNLDSASLKVTATTASRPGPDGADTATTVTVTNTSTKPAVGFFLRADVRRGTAHGHEQPGDNQVAAALWDDNDLTLWPGESQTITTTYRAAELHGAAPVVSVQGANTQRLVVAAPKSRCGIGVTRG
jgi:exo-1,4-beta-D-glucosaminidase